LEFKRPSPQGQSSRIQRSVCITTIPERRSPEPNKQHFWTTIGYFWPSYLREVCKILRCILKVVIWNYAPSQVAQPSPKNQSRGQRHSHTYDFLMRLENDTGCVVTQGIMINYDDNIDRTLHWEPPQNPNSKTTTSRMVKVRKCYGGDDGVAQMMKVECVC